MADLDDKTCAEVTRLSKEGESLLAQGQVKEAIYGYVQALKILPKPVTDWEAATWLFTAIGDAYWSISDFPRAHKAFSSALQSPGGIGNPFVHLRKGQLDYELGDREKAADELMRAYMGGDTEIFDGEDPKYFEVIAGLI